MTIKKTVNSIDKYNMFVIKSKFNKFEFYLLMTENNYVGFINKQLLLILNIYKLFKTFFFGGGGQFRLGNLRLGLRYGIGCECFNVIIYHHQTSYYP